MQLGKNNETWNLTLRKLGFLGSWYQQKNNIDLRFSCGQHSTEVEADPPLLQTPNFVVCSKHSFYFAVFQNHRSNTHIEVKVKFF